ncbi:hypothetical protein E5A73_08345 [Sphingomonas gei]|uniref:Uncharacterized protein n=1 Tax=Sphingomonas gei TaxID=1395960 RepID=A0A4S1XDE2_9SPHN|nr:contractile injection system tape measure protein [Sphingomonas gei]TGX54121.1 hypothetical protein E5A73_08345 [Sphingomonas gei]
MATGPGPHLAKLAHLIEEQILTVDVARELAGPALLDRVAGINRERFADILAQVLDEFDTPGERIRIDRISVTLGNFAPRDLDRAGGVLRHRLRVALAEALRMRGSGVRREREDRLLVSAFEHYSLHGTWPAARAIAPALRPADMLAQLIAEDPLALVAMLRRRGSSDALLRRLVRQMPEALLAALLHRLAPVHAAYILSYLEEVRESHAAERLISANPAELTEMLWTIVLRDALQQSGLQANRKAFLRRLLVQLARSGGTTLAALIAQLRRGLPRVLARRRAPGSLVAILSELVAEEPTLLAGQAGIVELAALLGRASLSPRQQRVGRRLVAAVGVEQLRWLLQRLARNNAARLDASIGSIFSLARALGAIWNIDSAGLPATLEALAANHAERIALLALAGHSAARGESAARPARALIARMRGVAPERIDLAPGNPLPRQRAEPVGPCRALAAALAGAAEHPTSAELTRIRERLARALAANPIRTRQMLRGFVAADAPRLCTLLGAADAPDAIAQHLLAAHLHVALTALARAARCTRAEWYLLLAVAAASQDDDLPEILLTRALAALARARHVPVAGLRAQLRLGLAGPTAAIGIDSSNRAAILTLCLPPAHAIDRLAFRHAALEQFGFLWEANQGLSAQERAAALTYLLPRLSGVAPAALRARLLASRIRHERLLAALPGKSLVRLALLLSISKTELRQLSVSEWRASIAATLVGEPRKIGDIPTRAVPNGARSRRTDPQRRIAALVRARPFAALQMIAASAEAPSELTILLEKPQTAPLLFAAMASAERERTSELLRLITGRNGRLAVASAKVARALALAAAAQDWRSRSGFATEWLRQLGTLASLAEQAALRRLLTDPTPRGKRGATQISGADREVHHLNALARAAMLLGLPAKRSPSALRRKLDQARSRALLARELGEAELVQLLAILAPTAASGLLHAAERLAAARRACAAPLARTEQWDCILAAARSARPIVQLTSLFLDGTQGRPAPPAPLRRRVETLLAASLEGMRDAPLRIALDLRASERNRRVAEAQPKSSEEAPAVLYVANAGLVLASAFLPRLFQSLDYVEPDAQGGWRWCDADCQARAVHLLQWLVDARTDAPEPQLALNKILCGLAIREPVAIEAQLDERELRMADILLRTILTSWPPLAESGLAALRETFFQRQGRLTRCETGWRLEVETRVLDILIDQLPWGFATILHPWMPGPLIVQWR